MQLLHNFCNLACCDNAAYNYIYFTTLQLSQMFISTMLSFLCCESHSLLIVNQVQPPQQKLGARDLNPFFSDATFPTSLGCTLWHTVLHPSIYLWKLVTHPHRFPDLRHLVPLNKQSTKNNTCTYCNYLDLDGGKMIEENYKHIDNVTHSQVVKTLWWNIIRNKSRSHRVYVASPIFCYRPTGTQWVV